MKKIKTISGQDLKEMFAAATSWLEKSAADIDALNVFPVPDGDCGTNMLLTMRSCVEETGRTANGTVSSVASAMAKGSLMGARGNSGVILSQIWRGIAQSLDGKDSVDSSGLAQALRQASKTAYHGVSNPTEGTILTVIGDMATAAEARVAEGEKDVICILEASVDAARESVANTPNLLPILRETGVVDAGGQGLFTLLEGALFYLRGETELMQFRKSRVIASNTPITARPIQVSPSDEEPFGYCTEFLLKGDGFDPKKLKRKLKSKGESLIVVGDNSTIRVHIHTLDPGNVLHFVASMGTMHKVSIRNMDEQHEDFLAMQKAKSPTTDIGIVAIVTGDGLADVFTSLGTSGIVSGGQTMNPSTKEILQAVESVASGKIIILPNNKNIVPAAEQVHSLSDKTVKVIPTETIPQGVVALLAFDYEADLDTNVHLMTEARSTVKTIEITRATRSTKINSLNIKKKQAIGLLNGKLLAASNDPGAVLSDLLTRAELDKAEVITVYYGADTKETDAEAIVAEVRQKYPELQIEIVDGGQPFYNYIVSIE
jgi:DAK2 domain fusion protein YloV